MKNGKANLSGIKMAIAAAAALMILISTIPAGAYELTMLTGDSTGKKYNRPAAAEQVQKADETSMVQPPVDYNKSLNDIFEVPPQP